MMNLEYFGIFMYISWLLKFVGVFFGGKRAKSCHDIRTNFATGQPVKLGKY